MDYRVRSKKDRKIEKVVERLISRITIGKPPSLLSPDSKPGEAVKKMSEEDRELLKEAEAKHFQNYPVKYPDK